MNNTVVRIRAFYTDFWNDLNWRGKSTVFPLLVLIFPIVLFMFLCFKDEE